MTSTEVINIQKVRRKIEKLTLIKKFEELCPLIDKKRDFKDCQGFPRTGKDWLCPDKFLQEPLLGLQILDQSVPVYVNPLG